MQAFISEDDLRTFEGWLKYQGFDAATITPEDLAAWRTAFEEMQKLKAAGGPKVGLMKLPPLVRGEYRVRGGAPGGGRPLADLVGPAFAAIVDY